ncbi:MAG: hypothetical protein C0403_10270 [Desulfobacterium sp.]|nr:hypothetical protein [Desulfobacterium sp.]
MGFFKNQEVKLAVRMLKWKYQNTGMPLPEESVIEKHAEKVVEDAHQIAKERGSNVMSIIKDLVAEIQKKK